MDFAALAICIIFSTIVISFIGARLFFFKINSQGSRYISLLNDPAVCIQMGAFYYYVFGSEPFWVDWRIVATLYLSGLGLFYWSIWTAKSLSFANSNIGTTLVTSGPYAIVRHPCYVSYSLIWIANGLLTNSPVIWISFAALVCVYTYSAASEEKYMLGSPLASEYREYKSKVGMFIPKLASMRN